MKLFSQTTCLVVKIQLPLWCQFEKHNSMKVWRVKEMVNHIEADGWYFVTKKGSHKQFKHRIKPGRVTIPGGLNDELAIGTAKSILKQAGLA